MGRVSDTSIELTWEPAYTKEGIVNYELLYKPVKFGSLVRPRTLFSQTSLQVSFFLRRHEGEHKDAAEMGRSLKTSCCQSSSFRSSSSTLSGETDLRAQELLHSGGPESKHGVLLLAGSHLQQGHRRVHQRAGAEDVTSQYVSV